MKQQDKVVTTGYTPRPLQLKLHKEVKRFNVIVCHRRWGKTVWAINEMIDKGLSCQLHNPRYAYIAPLYSQAKRVAWDYLKDFTKNIPGAKANEAELRVDVPRPAKGDTVRWTLLGGENPGSIRGIYLDGVILDEYAEMLPSVFSEVVRPALSDRKGWASFIGTFRGLNHFHKLYQDGKANPLWHTQIFKASETKIISEEELAAAQMVMSDDEYRQEYECDPQAGVTGAYYSKQIQDAEKVIPELGTSRICSVPHQSALLVDTYWDLGIGDSTAIWFVQRAGKEYHIIDYFEESGLSIPDIVKRLQQKPYTYGRTVLPHDAAAREMGTGRSRVEMIQELRMPRVEVLKRSTIDDGIQAVRAVFSQCWFDALKTAKGVDALKNYRRKWEEKNQVFSNTPMHSHASHGSDAFRYFAMGARVDVDYNDLPDEAEHGYNPLDGGFSNGWA